MTTDRAEFIARLVQRRPELAAEVLERQASEAAAALLAVLPADGAAATLGCMLPRAASRCLQQLGAEHAPAILTQMSPVTAAALLRGLPAADIEAMLEGAPARVARPLRFVLRYPSTVVGAWMQAGPFLLPADVSVAQALELARAGADELHRVVFVVDRQQRLRGALPAAALLREAGERELSGLMRGAPFALQSRTDLAAAAEHPGWSQWDPLPVINRQRRVVGLLHYADLRAALAGSTVMGGGGAGVVSGSLLEIMDLSWQGLADLLDGSLRAAPAVTPGPVQEESRHG